MEQTSVAIVDFYLQRDACDNYIIGARHDTRHCSWPHTAPHILVLGSYIPANDAGFQSASAVWNGLGKDDGKPAADQELRFGVHFYGREELQNSEKCADEDFGQIFIPREE